MSLQRVFWAVWVIAVLTIAIACIPVSAESQGKLAVPGLAVAQNYGGTADDIINDMCRTRDGGAIMIGRSESTDYNLAGTLNHGSGDAWVVKLNRSNGVEWSLCYGGGNKDEGTSIRQTADGGYIFTGYTFSNDGNVTGNHGACDAWVVKLTETGDIDWRRCYGGGDWDRGFCIRQTTDGGYILTGDTDSTNDDVSGNHGSTDIWVVKLDPTGEILWQRCLGGTETDTAVSCEQTTDNGYIIAGSTTSGDGQVSGHYGGPFSFDAWVVKLSEDGMLRWQRCLGGNSTDQGFSIQQTTGGGYIFLGETQSTDGDLSGNYGSFDVWVINLDQNGLVQWQKRFGGTGSDEGKAIQQTGDGGFLILGSTRSPDNDVAGIHNPLGGYSDTWLVQLDNTGGPLWQKCIGGDENDVPAGLQVSADGGYLVAMTSNSANGDAAGHHYGSVIASDALLVKLNGPPSLTGIAPSSVTWSVVPHHVVITGSNLQAVSSVRLSRPDTPYTFLVGLTVVPEGTTIAGDIEGNSITPGTYTVRVTTPDGQYAELPNAVTVICGPAPTVSSVTPPNALQGQTLATLTVKGTRFRGPFSIPWVQDVRFNRTGQPDIVATNITTTSATQLTCSVVIPAGALPGKWNVVVRNADGQYGMKANAFTVNLRTFKPPRVSSVTPRTVNAGNTTFINGILGSFFNASATVAMTGPRGASIPVSNVTVLSEKKITCDADLSAIPKGYASVTVTNPDGKKSTRARAFSIR